MSVTKLRIDLTQGIVEIEGDDSFVREVYGDFKEKLLREVIREEKTVVASNKSEERIEAKGETKTTVAAQAKKRAPSKNGSNLTIVKDLDLSGAGKTLKLKDFYAKYKFSSNMERNVLFLYYLQHNLELENINANHIFTCYRDTGVKVPNALLQSLRDTSSSKGWLDTANSDDLKITVHGMNFVEHDLAKAEAE